MECLIIVGVLRPVWNFFGTSDHCHWKFYGQGLLKSNSLNRTLRARPPLSGGEQTLSSPPTHFIDALR